MGLEWIVGLVSLAFALISAAFVRGKSQGRREGRQEAKNEQNADTIARTEAGRQAVSDGRSGGSDPDERLRDNDAHW